MPIRPDLRHFYRTPEYLAARERVVKRSKNRCEQCGKHNHRRVWVISLGYLITTDAKFQRCCIQPHQCWSSVKGDGQRWRLCTNGAEIGGMKLLGAEWKHARQIRVICTMAHLNHTPGDDRDDNLKFFCQWCHLHYDQLHHKATRSIRKDAKRPLLQEAS